MKLKSLRVQGFKSFADATTVDFHEGITAIVGPNGCGKSNIKDAIRWVLGEQRPTAIRGARMDEAIFQGSVNRRPVNRGSVSMVVTNEDGALPVPFEEVEIGRTVYRDGGSDYSINRSTCRLRDVHDLCRDTGLGANAYAVIENRMIDAILSERADERRALFEEASGIGKYKDRRKAALRRLEQAEADLQRLEDVIAEVETKVRSLARQKGKAERYRTLRERRLSVEVAVVRADLERYRDRLEALDRELTGDRQDGEGMVAELRAAEARYEGLRLQQVDAERARQAAAQRLEVIRDQLVRWERDLAVAAERAQAAEERLARIAAEREQGARRREELDGEWNEAAGQLAELEAELETAKGELERVRGQSAEVRARLDEARRALAEAETAERELVRRGAQLEGDAEAAESQAAELERRLERLAQELENTSHELSELQTQGDLFSDRVSEFSRQVEAARAAVAAQQEVVHEARRALEGAREEELDAQRTLRRAEAELSALEALEQAREGIEPAVSAALEARPKDALGTLADFIEAPAELAGVVEAYLGPLARGVVTPDTAAARRLAAWFEAEWEGGGGLILLPLDRAPEPERRGSLGEVVRGTGRGAPWVDALLAGLELTEDGLDAADPSAAVLSRAGFAVDERGIVRVGDPSGATGVLERRERMRVLAGEVEQATAAVEAAAGRREAARAALQEAEDALEQARAALREAEDGLRESSAEVQAQVDRSARADRHRDELARQIEGTRAARERALERVRTAREDRADLLGREEEFHRAREEAGRRLESVQERWEAVRAEESRLAVEAARLQGEADRARERMSALDAEVRRLGERAAELDAEERALAEALAVARALQEEGAAETETLFAQRDEAESDLRERDVRLQAVLEELAAAEKALRELRQAEREAVDRRHRLELERQEITGKVGMIQERLEGEWGRPLEVLLHEAEPVEGDPEVLREELADIVTQLERIGLVNMLAVEEHAEESARLQFLKEQREDLLQARNDLRTAIREINETAITLFEETFQAIRENFRNTFVRLFEGGEADLWLADPEDPLESPIEIHASPRGKKTQRIDLLSGGERALTALSLLFGIYLVKPSPFCVLDEVDAPLDESNIGRFIRLLQEFKEQTQFVVITHNPRTMEAADWIYGVTMEEPGVSKIVGVQLRDAVKASGSAA
ncbi:MAG: chromosome segregation protein SMC [Gemmatimonadetes bacterium]|nr:MAG: chromosome segregation protein SMC [Gemmatimonadota bacterium]